MSNKSVPLPPFYYIHIWFHGASVYHVKSNTDILNLHAWSDESHDHWRQAREIRDWRDMEASGVMTDMIFHTLDELMEFCLDKVLEAERSDFLEII